MPTKTWNNVLNDFGDEGLEISVATPSYPDRTILIDRDVYENLEGKITTNNKHQCLIRINGKSECLTRYIMGLNKEDKKVVVLKDGLLCDYRKENLQVIEPQRFKKQLRNKTVREYWIEAFKNTDMSWWTDRHIGIEIEE